MNSRGWVTGDRVRINVGHYYGKVGTIIGANDYHATVRVNGEARIYAVRDLVVIMGDTKRPRTMSAADERINRHDGADCQCGNVDSRRLDMAYAELDAERAECDEALRECAAWHTQCKSVLRRVEDTQVQRDALAEILQEHIDFADTNVMVSGLMERSRDIIARVRGNVTT